MIKNYKYIFAIGFSLLGAIIGYCIGWFLMFIFSLFGIGGFSGSGIAGLIASFLPIILGAISFASIIIGAIRGWKYGYKIGSRRNEKKHQTK